MAKAAVVKITESLLPYFSWDTKNAWFMLYITNYVKIFAVFGYTKFKND